MWQGEGRYIRFYESAFGLPRLWSNIKALKAYFFFDNIRFSSSVCSKPKLLVLFLMVVIKLDRVVEEAYKCRCLGRRSFWPDCLPVCLML